MTDKKISKSKAFQLVTPIIDDEVCAETRKVFFENIENYPQVQQHFKSIQNVKIIMQKRCPRAKASHAFYNRMSILIASLI